jgi:hypothetical protein
MISRTDLVSVLISLRLVRPAGRAIAVVIGCPDQSSDSLRDIGRIWIGDVLVSRRHRCTRPPKVHIGPPKTKHLALAKPECMAQRALLRRVGGRDRRLDRRPATTPRPHPLCAIPRPPWRATRTGSSEQCRHRQPLPLQRGPSVMGRGQHPVPNSCLRAADERRFTQWSNNIVHVVVGQIVGHASATRFGVSNQQHVPGPDQDCVVQPVDTGFWSI